MTLSVGIGSTWEGQSVHLVRVGLMEGTHLDGSHENVLEDVGAKQEVQVAVVRREGRVQGVAERPVDEVREGSAGLGAADRREQRDRPAAAPGDVQLRRWGVQRVRVVMSEPGMNLRSARTLPTAGVRHCVAAGEHLS